MEHRKLVPSNSPESRHCLPWETQWLAQQSPQRRGANTSWPPPTISFSSAVIPTFVAPGTGAVTRI